MSRTTNLLAGLGVVLILVLWYFLLWSPRVDELAAVEVSIEEVQASQATTRQRVGQLQVVREQAPQLQAELVAAEALLPREAALPSALRQLQQAADDSGATLVAVAPGRPALVEGSDTELHAMSLSLDLRGSYFQIVDTLRRLEDPTISPRGFVWESVSLATEEHPNLTVTVSGRMFAVLPPTTAVPGAEPDATSPAADGADGAVEAPADDVVVEPAPADAPTTDTSPADDAATEGEIQ